MREAMRARRKDMLQRLALVGVLFVIAYGGAALGVGGWPNILGVLVAVFGVATLLWVLDPAFQYLFDTAEDEEVQNDGDVV